MAKNNKKSVLSLLPQVGQKIHFWFNMPLWAEGTERRYPTTLKVFDVDERLVTECKAIEIDSNGSITKVLVNAKWPASADRLVNPNYKAGELIYDEDEAIKTLQQKYEEELLKASLIVKEKESQLECAKEDLAQLKKWADRALTIESLETDSSGKSYVVTDRNLTTEDIEKLAKNGVFSYED
jgi:hypothetical protein